MNQKEWLAYVTKHIEEDPYKRAVSWHLRVHLNDEYSTPKINYELTKLVKKGLLVRTSTPYCVEYRLP